MRLWTSAGSSTRRAASRRGAGRSCVGPIGSSAGEVRHYRSPIGASQPSRVPDPDRLGGLAWARRTNGRMGARERARLLGAIALGQWENALGRTKLALGRLPAGATAVDIGTFAIPDSRFAREAEQACAELPPALVGHSYRTWLFGRALAAVDGRELDEELFYCGSLLHDHGIAQTTPGRDFTLASAERTLACAAEAAVEGPRAELLADAICVHTTPGVRIARDGELGCYLQWGAMVDGAGLRLWDIAPANRAAVLERHPRVDFKRQLTAMMRAEAAALPGGRFGLLVRCGLPLAVRMAPFAE
jgi:hypothetical protein